MRPEWPVQTKFGFFWWPDGQSKQILTFGTHACCNPNIFWEIFEISSVHKSQIFENFHLALPPIFRGPTISCRTGDNAARIGREGNCADPPPYAPLAAQLFHRFLRLPHGWSPYTHERPSFNLVNKRRLVACLTTPAQKGEHLWRSQTGVLSRDRISGPS